MQTRLDFTADDEQKMKSAANWGAFIAGASILGALLGVASGVGAMGQASGVAGPGSGFAALGWVVLAINGGVPILLGIFLWQACAGFRRVATTDDDDPAYLLRGFKSLRAYFMTQGILLIVALVFMVLFVVAGESVFELMRPGS